MLGRVQATSRHIKYSKLKQLRKHSALRFEVQMLKLERHILNELEVTLTSLLSNTHQISR